MLNSPSPSYHTGIRSRLVPVWTDRGYVFGGARRDRRLRRLVLLPTLRLPQRLRGDPRPEDRRLFQNQPRRFRASSPASDTSRTPISSRPPSPARRAKFPYTDFMPLTGDNDGDPDTPPPDPPHEIHRIVTCISGQVELRCDFRPRHDYARAVPDFRPLGCSSGGAAVQVGGGRQTMTLLASIPLSVDRQGVSAAFVLAQGETATFVLAYRRRPPHQPGAPPDRSQAGPDRQLLERPGGAYELRRTMARARLSAPSLCCT